MQATTNTSAEAFAPRTKNGLSRGQLGCQGVIATVYVSMLLFGRQAVTGEPSCAPGPRRRSWALTFSCLLPVIGVLLRRVLFPYVVGTHALRLGASLADRDIRLRIGLQATTLCTCCRDDVLAWA